ncbi:MAG: glycine--tRNA ligase [Verrucomicrobia bacterium]|nr:glycine--tRNA ligase [Verrucomicrobiota bacterium]
MLTFQQLIHRLTTFWEKKQCVIHQGHDLEVGAGTFNPATFLRCLGPEPYRTAYVEPSRRPADGRYGENPNRFQLFHQFQVILKPSPADVQQMYLESLEALGLDLKKHDIRFVHDDWESPTIGAWGLGWEVWCDGMEITQFTYFQVVGGMPLKPISVEITYGLERLAMFIQNKESFFDLKWNDTLTFGDIQKTNEIEWSRYNFEEASTSMWLRHFEDYEKEAKTLIARHLPLPAYDFVIKASHAFNMLDARGAISVTERTGYIGRLRDLSRLISAEYVSSRETLGFPLIKSEKQKALKPPAVKTPPFNPKKRQDFLLEIGSEQLPATFVPIGSANLEKAVRQLLEERGLAFDHIACFGTPQRLAVLVKGLVEGTEEQESIRRGPALSAAFDSSGKATRQGEGFLKSVGAEDAHPGAIRQGKVKGLTVEGDYLFAKKREEGKSTFLILAEELPQLILGLDFPKKMRWGSLDISYARPIRWIVALFGSKVIPFLVGDILSGKDSFGHAQLSPKKIPLKLPKEYAATLKKHFVLADSEERKKSIAKQLQAIEKKTRSKALSVERVLKEVLHLVEWPQLTYAEFRKDFLRAPQEVLISEMVEHQRYFPLADAKGILKNLFVITADNKPNDLIRKGNQKVLSARLSDGVFLYEQDLKTPLEKFNEKLRLMTYQKELGTMLDKVERLASVSAKVNQHLAIADARKLARAALLSKADLASALVGEFPELQGTIGKIYALKQKEDPEVASAIEEHWMPTAEGAPLPKTACGTILSLADKIDNLLSCYSLGLKPTSSSDPYALRRQSIGLLRMLIEGKESVNLKTLLEEACLFFPKITGKELVHEILTFLTARAKSVFEEYGFKKDEIEASLQGLCIDPYDQFCKTEALHTFRKSGVEFAKLFEVYKRAKGQLEKPSPTPFNPNLATEPAEHELMRALDAVGKHWNETLGEKRYLDAFRLLATLQKPLAHLFDSVKILAEDLGIQRNRIALLQRVFGYFEQLLSFSKIQEG